MITNARPIIDLFHYSIVTAVWILFSSILPFVRPIMKNSKRKLIELDKTKLVIYIQRNYPFSYSIITTSDVPHRKISSTYPLSAFDLSQSEDFALHEEKEEEEEGEERRKKRSQFESP